MPTIPWKNTIEAISIIENQIDLDELPLNDNSKKLFRFLVERSSYTYENSTPLYQLNCHLYGNDYIAAVEFLTENPDPAKLGMRLGDRWGKYKKFKDSCTARTRAACVAIEKTVKDFWIPFCRVRTSEYGTCYGFALDAEFLDYVLTDLGRNIQRQEDKYSFLSQVRKKLD